MVEVSRGDQRAEQIRRTAVRVFSDVGFKRASMAVIAEACGLSRPALYQYFDSREDLFRASMELVLGEAAAAAVQALDEEVGTPTALAGWLRRSNLDGYAALWDTAFGEELLEAHHLFARDVADLAHATRVHALKRYLGRQADASPSDVVAALDLLTMAPVGLKSDGPTPEVYGRRLDDLARAAAALLGATP